MEGHSSVDIIARECSALTVRILAHISQDCKSRNESSPTEVKLLAVLPRETVSLLRLRLDHTLQGEPKDESDRGDDHGNHSSLVVREEVLGYVRGGEHTPHDHQKNGYGDRYWVGSLISHNSPHCALDLIKRS